MIRTTKVSQIEFQSQEFLRHQNVTKSPKASHVDTLRFRLGTNKNKIESAKTHPPKLSGEWLSFNPSNHPFHMTKLASRPRPLPLQIPKSHQRIEENQLKTKIIQLLSRHFVVSASGRCQMPARGRVPGLNSPEMWQGFSSLGSTQTLVTCLDY